MDGTLINSTYADAVWLQGLPKRYAAERHISLSEAQQILYSEYDKIGENRIEWYDLNYWFKRFNIPGSPMELLRQYTDLIEPYAEVAEVVKRLHETYVLIVVSNAKYEFVEIELETTGLMPFFTHIFSSTSGFRSVNKEPRVYLDICEKLEVMPDEVVHVGDKKVFDYYNPRQVGMHAVYLGRDAQQSTSDCVGDLEEFERVLEKNIRSGIW